MVKLIITGHGDFSNGMYDAINFIMGAVDGMVKVEFDNLDLEAYSSRIEEHIKDSGDGALIFTDLVGGTPFRISTLLCTRYDNLSVITGANIPMMIEAVVRRKSMPLKELAEQIGEIGRSSIKVFDSRVLLEKSQEYNKQ